MSESSDIKRVTYAHLLQKLISVCVMEETSLNIASLECN